MKRWKRTLIMSGVEVVFILMLHAFLIRWLAERDLVSKLFAAGNHLPISTIAVIVIFLLARFLAVMALPGIVLARLGLVAWEYLRGEKKRPEEQPLP